jgi:hypothetical protein
LGAGARPVSRCRSKASADAEGMPLLLACVATTRMKTKSQGGQFLIPFFIASLPFPNRTPSSLL